MQHATRALAALAAVLALAPWAAADTAPRFAPDEGRIRKDVAHLASDALEGRNAGQPGSEAAARFLAERFEALGLEPIGDEGSYFQKFTFDVRGASSRTAETVNVVGLLRGSDEERADQVIVIGAHYDHVGRAHHPDAGRIGKKTPGDDIWNGADDNASGTSAVLEIARLLTGADPGPRRSVLFILFGAEEHGLLGSRHYVSDPIVPLERTVAMVNLDMVGRNPTKPISVTGIGSASAFAGLLDDAQRDDRGLRLDRMGITLPGGSDHTPFILKKVPALFVSTGLHEDYHRVTDHADKVSYEQIVRVARLTAMTAMGLGEVDRPRFSWATANPFPTLGRLALRELEAPPVLGVTIEAAEGGARISRVLPRTRAAAAGLRAGDIVTEVDGAPLGGDPVQSLQDQIRGADRFGSTGLRILRDGQPIDVVVVWRG